MGTLKTLLQCLEYASFKVQNHKQDKILRHEEQRKICLKEKVIDEAKKNLKTEKEKSFAEECIQGYLTEMNATYQVTERYPTTVIVKFNTKDKPEDYELFYDLVSEGKSNLVPFRQYAMENWKENVQERRQMGKEVLLENVEIDMENLKNQN